MTSANHFELLGTDGAARTGLLTTPHGRGADAGLHAGRHRRRHEGFALARGARCRADIVLGNTYHLMLRPGAERIAALGGLQRFTGWQGPMLTDSGGFQVMSLSELRKVTENAVTFRSHIDGAKIELSPERSIEVQRLLGSDIAHADGRMRAAAGGAQRYRARDATLIALGGAQQARLRGRPEGYMLFGIAQGGDVPELRRASARGLVETGFHGYAIGGARGRRAAIGDAGDDRGGRADPARGRPRYLMGVGTPEDLLEAVGRGVDIFDCVMPTQQRAPRNGVHAVRSNQPA